MGLRSPHADELSRDPSVVDLLELLTDNLLVEESLPRQAVGALIGRVPVALHGVGLSVGSADGLDGRYLDAVARLADETRPLWFSDHLCWTRFEASHFHDLLPLPYTEEALVVVVENIRRAQQRVGVPFLVENVSSYLQWPESTLTEWEFLARVAEGADCGILLDVNNVHVSAHNNEFDPDVYLAGIPAERVMQYHLAGFSDAGTHLLDDHGSRVHDVVWALFDRALERIGPRPTIVEWDTGVPTLDVLLAEARRAGRQLSRAARHAA